jgi:type IV secretion system protein TrbL
VEVGLLTEIMNVFVDAFSGGFDRIRPAIGALLRLLIGIEFMWFSLLLLFGVECFSNGLKKAMTIGIWAYVSLHFDEHALALVDSLVKGGLIAAGAEGQSARQLLNPSAIFDAGFTAVHPIGQRLMTGSLMSFSATFPLYLITWLLMLGAHGMLAVSAFMIMIEYYLAIAVVGILVPFGILGPTRWMAMKPMGYFLSCGLKMMVVSFLVAVSRTALLKIHFNATDITLREMGIAICCTSMICLLVWKAPERLSHGFMMGSASFGGSDVVRHTMSTVAAVAAPVVTALSAIRDEVHSTGHQPGASASGSAGGGAVNHRTASAGLPEYSPSAQPSAAFPPNPPTLVQLPPEQPVASGQKE